MKPEKNYLHKILRTESGHDRFWFSPRFHNLFSNNNMAFSAIYAKIFQMVSTFEVVQLAGFLYFSFLQCLWHRLFLGALAQSRKAPNTFVMYVVCPFFYTY
jgi:hypothetical protein